MTKLNIFLLALVAILTTKIVWTETHPEVKTKIVVVGKPCNCSFAIADKLPAGSKIEILWELPTPKICGYGDSILITPDTGSDPGIGSDFMRQEFIKSLNAH